MNIIFYIYDGHARALRGVPEDKQRATNTIVDVLHFVVNHFEELLSLRIEFPRMPPSTAFYVPHLLRKQLYKQPLRRPHRLRYSDRIIQVWL